MNGPVGNRSDVTAPREPRLSWGSGRGSYFQIAIEKPRDRGGELLGQSSNQAQQFLLLWSVASRDEKGSDLNVYDLST